MCFCVVAAITLSAFNQVQVPHNGVRYLAADNATAPGYSTTVPFNFTYVPGPAEGAMPLVVVLGETGVGSAWYTDLANALAAQGCVWRVLREKITVGKNYRGGIVMVGCIGGNCLIPF